MAGMVYALVLLGCADGGAQCTPLAQPLSTHDTRSACEARVPAALESDLSLRADFPTVVAQCEVRTARIARQGKPHTAQPRLARR